MVALHVTGWVVYSFYLHHYGKGEYEVVRGVVSKVMRVGRATVFVVGLAVILAFLFGVASMALGANGRPFILGDKNTASRVSQLVKSGVGPALALKVESGPPLSVNSSGKVADLNADRLDDMNSTSFARARLFGSAVNGQIGDTNGPECTMGEIRLFAGKRASRQWLPADGRHLPIAQNTALYSLLETTYGGNGTSTFALPDLRGAEPRGAGPAAPFYAICVTGFYP